MATRTKSASKASQAVDRQLERYRSMRDFGVTQEPSGRRKGRITSQNGDKLPFVVQKHAASRLHYDFRLGWRGVLKSWAVAKGPSNYPGDKRLAVQVEDHPIEYGGFEGTIPMGQYGGGTVMVWDFGDWEPHGDVDQGLEKGHLKFELHGSKLKGGWALVRMHGHGERPEKPNWLLIKESDSFARSAEESAVTNEAPESAITNRSMAQIAASEDHSWNSKHAERNGSAKVAEKSSPTQIPHAASAANQSHSRRTNRSSILKLAPREAFPHFIAPQLAQQATKPPNGKDWIHELKLDGYRIQIHVTSTVNRARHDRKAKLFTRKGLDWTARMPDIAHGAAQLQVKNAVLDGEVVAQDERGNASFADLQSAFHDGKSSYLTYFAFDLLHLDGHNLRNLSLVQRKELLGELLSHTDSDSPLRLSEHLQAKGDEVFAKACALGAEGIVSKLASANYTSGRRNSWIKVKCTQEQEFVIGGFTYPSKGERGVGAILLGYYEGGKLRYAGRSGTGFTQQTQRTLRAQLDALARKQSPFVETPREARKNAHWVRPELVAQIAFATWTRENLVRQAAFKGLREDKPPSEVVREVAVDQGKSSRVTYEAEKRSTHRSRTIGKEKTRMADLPITHPNKVLDEESGMTKQALAEYYLAVAQRMLPHVADRPLSVVRCPEGSGKPCFFQKHVGRGLPTGVNSVSIPNRKTGESEDFLTLNTPEGLVGLAQMGVLEIHPWGSRNESLDKPDRIVFDLDPDSAIDWRTLAGSAQELRARLRKVQLETFLKSTGGKGLHVVVPIEAAHDWPVIKQFAHNMVQSMEKEEPDLYITRMTKSARKGRIYLDYLRNDREATSIAPFSPRARSGAPVAMTLDWKELSAKSAPVFHVSDFEKWKERLRRDPWKAMETGRQRLSLSALRTLGAQNHAHAR
ncbi:MAG: DNA ligase D [Terracidiphilus sp.]